VKRNRGGDWRRKGNGIFRRRLRFFSFYPTKTAGGEGKIRSHTNDPTGRRRGGKEGEGKEGHSIRDRCDPGCNPQSQRGSQEEEGRGVRTVRRGERRGERRKGRKKPICPIRLVYRMGSWKKKREN